MLFSVVEKRGKKILPYAIDLKVWKMLRIFLATPQITKIVHRGLQRLYTDIYKDCAQRFTKTAEWS